MSAENQIQQVYQEALKARSRAHAPYSKFAVGAAVKLKGIDQPVVGCNVENASFGATVCAERSALLSAVSQHGTLQPEYIVIVTGEDGATQPCALCLQVMAEFCADEMPVYMANLKGVQKKLTFKELLPHPFRAFAPEGKPE